MSVELLSRIENRRAYSLPEILLVLALLVVLLAISVGTTPRGGEGDPNTVAELVASELGFARSQAMRTGYRVAVAFPSDAGTRQFSDSVYTLTGAHDPVFSSQRTWATEQRGISLFFGSVNTASPSLVAADWGHPYPDDPTLCFLPDGTVEANLPQTNNSYYLCALKGGQSTGDTLSAAHDPIFIEITPSGAISVKGDISGSLGVGQMAAPNSPLLSSLPAFPSAGNTSPYDLVVTAGPAPVSDTLPPGIDATVKWDGYLTLKFDCEDDQGDQLLCAWNCDDGALSSKHDVEMNWNEETRKWEGVWVWYPPADAAGNSVYTLTCEVRDGRGGTVDGRVGALGRVLVLPKGRIVFQTDADGDQDIYTINADGTDLTKLTDNKFDDDDPSWFPDGQRFAFVSAEPGPPPRHKVVHSDGIYIANFDGTEKRRILPIWDYGFRMICSIAVDPGGRRIAFLAMNHPDYVCDLYLINADGTDPDNPGVPGIKRLTFQNMGGGGVRGLCWTHDGTHILYGGGHSPGSQQGVHGGRGSAMALDLWECEVSTGAVRQLTFTPNELDMRPTLDPTGTTLFYHAWNGGPYSLQADYQPGQPLGAPTIAFGNRNRTAIWSPDGQQAILRDANDTSIVITNRDGSVKRTLVDFPGSTSMEVFGWVLR